MNKGQVLGIIRHVLTAVGVIVVYKGYVDEATTLMVIGTITTAVSQIWSLFDKTEAQIEKKAEEIQLKRELNKE